jgi:hypothetical protein
MKMLVNEVWTEIAYEDDGHLVRTDKRSGKQTISFRVWPDVASADRALAAGLEIRWEDIDEF